MSTHRPRYEVYSPAAGKVLIDENGEEWVITWEYRWTNLNVEHSKDASGLGLCRYYAFADTYKALSQIVESRRPKESRRFFDCAVGESQRLSINHLLEVAPDNIVEIVNIMNHMGITTSKEFGTLIKNLEFGDGGMNREGDEIIGALTEQKLRGMSRHTISDDVFYSLDFADPKPFEKAIDLRPMWLSVEASSVQIIAREDGFLYRYPNDKEKGQILQRHAVMSIGRGSCRNKRTGEQSGYVVGQNNWADNASEICRCSYNSVRMALGFNVGPTP